MGSGDFNAVSSSRRRTGAKIEHRVSLRLCAFLEGGRIWGAGAFEHGRSPVSSEGRRAGTFSCSKSPLLQVRLALGCLNWRRMKLTCSGGFKKTCFGQLIVRAIPPGFPRYRARIGSTILKKATNSKTLLRDKTVDFTARMWYNTGAKWKWTEIRRSFAPKLRVRTLPCALVVVSIRADSYYMQRRCGDRDNISQSLSARGVWISTSVLCRFCGMGNVTLRTGSVDFNLRTLSIPRQPRVTLRTGSVDFNIVTGRSGTGKTRHSPHGECGFQPFSESNVYGK